MSTETSASHGPSLKLSILDPHDNKIKEAIKVSKTEKHATMQQELEIKRDDENSVEKQIEEGQSELDTLAKALQILSVMKENTIKSERTEGSSMLILEDTCTKPLYDPAHSSMRNKLLSAAKVLRDHGSTYHAHAKKYPENSKEFTTWEEKASNARSKAKILQDYVSSSFSLF